jgi:hypothetical protein
MIRTRGCGSSRCVRGRRTRTPIKPSSMHCERPIRPPAAMPSSTHRCGSWPHLPMRGCCVPVRVRRCWSEPMPSTPSATCLGCAGPARCRRRISISRTLGRRSHRIGLAAGPACGDRPAEQAQHGLHPGTDAGPAHSVHIVSDSRQGSAGRPADAIDRQAGLDAAHGGSSEGAGAAAAVSGLSDRSADHCGRRRAPPVAMPSVLPPGAPAISPSTPPTTSTGTGPAINVGPSRQQPGHAGPAIQPGPPRFQLRRAGRPHPAAAIRSIRHRPTRPEDQVSSRRPPALQQREGAGAQESGVSSTTTAAGPPEPGRPAILYINTVTRRIPVGYRHGHRVTGMRTCPVLPPPSRANRPLPSRPTAPGELSGRRTAISYCASSRRI